MVDIKKLTKSYENKIVLNNISFDFKKANTSVIIGQSGCGKSTLIKLILGLIEQFKGEIFIKGQRLSSENIRTIRHQTGYVTQGGGLFPHLTAFENIALMPRFFKWEEQKIKSRIIELLDLTKLPTELIDQYPKELSGGQKQRVSLMRSLVLDPDLILLDEPLGALDPIIRKQLQDDLKEIFSTLNKTVILVTHDMGEAVYFADEIILMNEGQIIQNGRAEELIHRPVNDFVSDFINAQRNYLESV